MAVIINLETSTTNCSVSIARDGELIQLREDNSFQYSHSEQLHLFIREVLQETSLSFQDISAIAVSKGPGSYTGLRIGVSAAKGLCFSLDLPLISVPTLEVLAEQEMGKGYDFIVPVLDARRMDVYAVVFDAYGKQIRDTRAETLQEDCYRDYAERGKVLLIGDGAEKCRELLGHPNFVFKSAMPSSREMAGLSYTKFRSAQFEDVAYFEPFYLKDFILQGKRP